MRPFEIYFASVLWGGCQDERPWVIVDVRPNNRYGCMPLSSHCYRGDCFLLPADHPDFPAAGLKKSCYIHLTTIFELDGARLLRRKGELLGELLTDFRSHAGL
jgi:hypothetical protein